MKLESFRKGPIRIFGVWFALSLFDLARTAERRLLGQNPKKYGVVAGYLAAFAAISSSIYYLPNYSWLESATAYHSALLMRFFGMPAIVKVTEAGVQLNQFLVDRPCTGIQVVATFAGILIPLPRLKLVKKVFGLALVVVGVYMANLARIVIQLRVYNEGYFDWTAIHGQGGVALGIVSVTFLVLLLDFFVPEFGDFVFSVLERAHRRSKPS